MPKKTNVVEFKTAGSKSAAPKAPVLAYDVRQSPVDKMFRTWVRMDWKRLGLVSDEEIAEAKGGAYINPSQEVCVLVTKKRPKKDEVVAILNRRQLIDAAA